MSQKQTRTVLDDLELNLDSSLIEEILVQIKNISHSRIARPLIQEEIWAVAGLVCESQKIIAMDGETLVGPAVPLESFIVKIPASNRLQFKMDDQSGIFEGKSLVYKIVISTLSKLSGSFRRFFMLRNSVRGVNDKESKLTVLASLFINRAIQIQKKNQIQILLIVIFGRYLATLHPFIIIAKLEQSFGFCIDVDQMTLLEYEKLLGGQLMKVYSKRSQTDQLQMKRSLLNENFCLRMLDDYSNMIGKEEVGRLAFVQLNKCISPMQFHPKFIVEEHSPITKRLCFSSDYSDSEIQEEL